MRMTNKQVKILGCLIDKNPDGTEMDLDQLLEKLRDGYQWDTSKASIQFSLRRLISYGLIVKQDREVRRNRKRAILAVTDLGRSVMKG